jgi:hypothetical protein
MSRTKDLWHSTVTVPFPLWLLVTCATWAWVPVVAWWLW